MLSPLQRERNRERNRDHRARRLAKTDALRTTHTALERAVPILLTLDNDKTNWLGFLDADALRVRSLMCKALALTKEARELANSQRQLAKLLEEHRVAARVLCGLRRTYPMDGWDIDVARWRRLTRQFYRPWTLEACQDEIDASLRQVRAFQWSTDKQTADTAFLGWHTALRVDTARNAFQFEFTKTFRSDGMDTYVDAGWKTFTDAETCKHVLYGHRVRVHLDLLQALTPKVLIIRGVERFPESLADAHYVNLVFRVENDDGVTLCVRSLCCSELMKALDGPHDMWPSNFVWLQWTRLANGERGYQYRSGGTVQGADVTYARQWMLEALGCLLRIEQLGTSRSLLPSTS